MPNKPPPNIAPSIFYKTELCPIRAVISKISALRALEHDGFVKRTAQATIPPRVDYELTDRAHSFLPILQNMMQWGLENRKNIERDQESYTQKKIAS